MVTAGRQSQATRPEVSTDSSLEGRKGQSGTTTIVVLTQIKGSMTLLDIECEEKAM